MSTSATQVEDAYRSSLRGRIFAFFAEPTASRPALVYALFMMVTIVTSTVVFLVGSMPQYWQTPPVSLFIIETITVSIFTIDYISKVSTSQRPLRFIIQPFSIIDLLSILPYYLELILSSSVSALAVVRVLRLLRLLRIVRLGYYSKTVSVIGVAVIRSRDGIYLLLFIVSLCLVVFSTLVFFAEQSANTFDTTNQVWLNPDGSTSNFQSIPQSFWWCIITITTVGYGDYVPVSPAGKAVGAVTALFGVMVLAFPITVLISNFSDVMNEQKAEQDYAERKAALAKSLADPVDVSHRSLVSLLADLETANYQADQELAQHEEMMTKVAERLEWMRVRQNKITEGLLRLRAMADARSSLQHTATLEN